MVVTVIEMVGMVGAGKTTLASALCDDLGRRGLTVLRVEAAIPEVLGRSALGAVSRRLLPSSAARRRALRAGYKLAVRPWHMVRFALRHPGVSWAAARAVSRTPLPLWHRRKILGLFFRPAAAQLYFGPRLRSDEVLLLEEGLVHRAVNLFAWSSGGVDRTAVASYLGQLPATELVVLVAAPLATCIERIGSRGLPQRLTGRDGDTVARFMDNAAEIVDGIPGVLRGTARRWILVDNGGTPTAAVASLRAALDAHLSAGRAVSVPPAATDGGGRGAPGGGRGTTPPTTPRFSGGVRVPRPPRSAVGWRRRPPRLPPDLVDDVLASFDLRAVGPVRGVSATSRADNVIVATSSGAKLVKRYKASVAAPAITHEHSILRYLATLGFPSPRLAVARDGATAREHAGRWYACFEYRHGFFHYNEYLWSPRGQRRLVGLSAQALAGLHAALHDFAPEGANPNGFVSRDGPRVRDIGWYLDGLERARRHGGRGIASTAFRTLVEERAPALERELRALDAQLTSATLPRQVIHGDYGPYNLLFRRGERIVVLDFELARIDWRLTDLAKALQQFGVNRFGLQFRRIARFVADYERHRPLAASERRLLPSVWLFLTLRRVAVCLDRFAESESERWLTEAQRKLALAAMIRSSADTLSGLGGAGGTRWSA